jgi:Ankyrin repeats (many copies)
MLAGCGGDGGSDRRRPAPGALLRAAAAGDAAEVRRLLAAGADVDERTAGGRTAVTAAALGDHVDAVRALIDGARTSTSRTPSATTRSSSPARRATSRCSARSCGRSRT